MKYLFPAFKLISEEIKKGFEEKKIEKTSEDFMKKQH